MYKEIKGDLIKLAKKSNFNIILHGTNCFKNMEAGIALQIKNHFPHAYLEDRYDKRSVRNKYGDLTYSHDYLSNTYIVNLYSQCEPGANFNECAFRMSLIKLKMVFVDTNLKIGLPKIGCRIGGGNWKNVKKIIQEELKDYDVTVVIYDKQ